MVLPETDGEGAVIVADRCRREIEASRFEANGETLGVTMSLGVATFYPDRESSVNEMADLIKLADEALYSAKDGGRNQVTLDKDSK